MTTKPKRIAFSGQFCSGKDYVAEAAGFHVVSIAEPMYAICESIFGSCNKKREDHRKFLQTLGQLGWGSPNVVQDASSASLVMLMRQHGAKLSRCSYVKEDYWWDFGNRTDFWIRIALAKVKSFSRSKKVAITNARFIHEIEPLKAAGFDHYLVRCSYQTRVARNGGQISANVEYDESEKLAKELVDVHPPEKTIWNDTEKPPLGCTGFLTVEQFVAMMNENHD